MADEAKVGPVDSGLLQADIAVESAEKARKAEKAKKEKGKDPVLHLKKPDPDTAKKPEPVATVAETDEVDDDGESAGDEDEQQSTTNPGKANTPRGVQKKLDKLTRQKYEADARAEYWEQQAKAKAETPTPKPESAEGKPTLAQFNYDQEQYLEALSDWRIEAKLAEAEKRKAESEKEKTEHERLATYRQRLSEFVVDHPDYEQVAIFNPINYSPTMLEFVKDSKVGPQIGYYLGQHLEEAKEIEAMPAYRQAIALDRLERGLSEPEVEEPSVPQRRTITQAPPPPATIASSGHNRRSITDPNLTSAERIAMWRRKKTG
jgi:hypothetical protein